MTPRPVCFVVMPFGTKETGAAPPAPATVDFDALWRDAIKPALEALNYRAVRADEDRGALIIGEMIERLYYSDLVIADVSIPNANVYYEVGLRHAARNSGCVLIGADWAQPVFDVAQMRRVPYPNATPVVDAAGAERIRTSLIAGIKEKAQTTTPPPEVIKGLQPPVVPDQGTRSNVLADQLDAYDELYATLNTIRGFPGGKAQAREWLAGHPPSGVLTAYVATITIPFVRDVLGWQDTVAYIEGLPADVRSHAFVKEQEALARAKGGSHFDAIQILTGLIASHGATPERLGLLGGRYKKLYSAERATDPPGARRLLNKAIESYEQGMRLDLNQYYCSCNLPALYRERNAPGDETLAVATAAVARTACERYLTLGLPDDGWLRQTLLGLTFAERNASAARELVAKIAKEGAVAWQLETTMDDLKRHVTQMEVTHPQVVDTFKQIVQELALI